MVRIDILLLANVDLFVWSRNSPLLLFLSSRNIQLHAEMGLGKVSALRKNRQWSNQAMLIVLSAVSYYLVFGRQFSQFASLGNSRTFQILVSVAHS